MLPELLDVLITDWPGPAPGQSALVLGLSGGLDSIVLLDLLCRWRDEFNGPALSAIHVHHGLSPNADAWAAFCGQRCDELAVPLQITHVRLARTGGQGLEAEARAARYAAYASCEPPVLVLAHHADDQQETLLLQLLRGGGPRALAGMPVWRAWQGKQIWRPLIRVGRRQLEQYAHARGLVWVEDESNQDTHAYLRNFVRHDILPRLQQRVPALASQLQRAALRMQDAVEMADALAAIDLQSVTLSGGGLSRSGVLSLSAVRQRYVMLAFLRHAGLALPAPEALQEWLRQLGEGAAEPQLSVGNGLLLAYHGEIRFLPGMVVMLASLPLVHVGEDLDLPVGQLVWSRRAGGFANEYLGLPLQMKWRQGGERLVCKVGRKTLKNCFQEAGVPVCLREQWPLLHDMKGELLAVPGVGVAYDRQASAEGWWPVWLPAGVMAK